jgi:hypothetical protein
MSRGITSKRDALSVLRLRLLAELKDLDYWTGSFDIGDEAIAKLVEARIALQETIVCVGEAEELVPDEER